MESGGGAWRERLRPLQLPRRPPLCDRLTHLPLSLAVNNIHERTSSSPVDMSLLASTQTHTDHKKHFPWRALHTWGGGRLLFDASFDWCMYWSGAWALLWSGRPYTWSPLRPGLLLLEIFLSNERRAAGAGRHMATAGVRCFLQLPHGSTPQLSFEMMIWAALVLLACFTVLLLKKLRIYLEFCLFYESKLFCTGSQLICRLKDLTKHSYIILACAF